jgi:triacylglycerol lipase
MRLSRCLYNDCAAAGARTSECTPIVLHHGLFGMNLELGPIRLSYFNKIDGALARLGHPLLVANVHPTASIETRARQLKQRILGELGDAGPRLVIIAHSMGGLDARYMISKLDMASRVAALVTITCPHRGSPYADWCVNTLGHRLRTLKLLEFLRLDVGGFTDLTTKSCTVFNREIVDDPAVKYFSVSAARPIHCMPPWGIHSYKIIHEIEGANDGLVSVQSSGWGEHLGTWPADHWHTINHRGLPEPRDHATGDISPYYLDLVKTLRDRGYITGRPAAEHAN